jgi:hypothetical protein
MKPGQRKYSQILNGISKCDCIMIQPRESASNIRCFYEDILDAFLHNIETPG